MFLGYNTNGFAHHRLADALTILREIGYESVALTLDREVLDPPDRRGLARAVSTLKPLLASTGFRVTIETGARFVLDIRRKHQPTLLSPTLDERRARIEFLLAAIDLAAEVGADAVSLWSGAPPAECVLDTSFFLLREGLGELLDHGERRNVRLAFEPEPGMFIETMAQFERLMEMMNHPLLGLTLDVGHVHCLNDGDLQTHLNRWRSKLWNVHIEDMRRGVHEHLMFGDGDVDFAAVFAALHSIEYSGPLHVELSRHSHDAFNAARGSYEFLKRLVELD